MKNLRVCFKEPNVVVVEEIDSPFDSLQDDQILVESLYTSISAGTELACLSGVESWFKLGQAGGYCSVGRVVAEGKNVADVDEGDVLFSTSRHQQFSVLSPDLFYMKAPEGIPLKLIPLTRMAGIALTSVRASDIELGDDVAVVGMGLIGNFAAQLAQLQGARTIAVDVSGERLEMARACGISTVVKGTAEEAVEQVRQLTNGAGVSTLIDGTGVSKAILSSIPMIGNLGELILLGTPRGEYMADVTELLNYCHQSSKGSVTIKGAHENRYPRRSDQYVKHSLERNLRILWDLLKAGKIEFEKLISHTIKPAEAPQIYAGLRNQPADYMGVAIDWTNQ